MDIADLTKLARDYLVNKHGRGMGHYRYLVQNERNTIITRDCVLDYRIQKNEFRHTYFNIFIEDNLQSRYVGNMTIFSLSNSHYKLINFWKIDRNRQTGSNYLQKVSLHDYMAGRNADGVIMHGYVESPRYKTKTVYTDYYTALAMRYVKFVAALEKLGKENNTPMLIETTGLYQLSVEQRARQTINLMELNQSARSNVGVSREESIASKKLAKHLGLIEIPDTYNERTLGKVYISQMGCNNG
ncbi:MAG: hypothetical protein K1563_12365 [Candidatus Thiodiazotropha sp. (ex. Lucinisca nassula)]|nr:hypothetical protein [Candidatus Thiodiazotropha sp. (ex. Lucinisca nassula)]MBW9274472.1 hypothetical protein [Candidatus Thiodiazotropha sp. (ex. Lucinisca nassula)]